MSAAKWQNIAGFKNFFSLDQIFYCLAYKFARVPVNKTITYSRGGIKLFARRQKGT